MRRQPQAQKGFTLLEVAIVLAIAGLVISGLWAGGNAIQKNMQVNTAVDQINQIAINMRALYASRQTIYGSDTAFNVTLDQSKVFPIDMRRDRTVDGGPIDHTWNSGIAGGSVTAAGYDLAANTAAPPAAAARSFRVEFASVPSDICNRLITHSFVADADVRLQAIIVRGGATTSFLASNGDLPPPFLTATTACNSSTTPTIDWVYSLH